MKPWRRGQVYLNRNIKNRNINRTFTHNYGKICISKQFCFDKCNMRTTYYNPSKLEVKFAKALEDLTPTWKKLDEGERVIGIASDHEADNPMVTYKLEDNEGDLHEVVVQIIQRPDHIVK